MPRFTVNKGTLMVNVVCQVNSSTIRKEVVNGESYIVVPSYTLPDDIVMNGKLYPKEVNERDFKTLEGTHAPIGHPKNANGEFILASDPDAMVNGYLVGAKNKNVRREGNRVYLEKWVPERLTNNSEKGKRLLDRLNALMNGNGEPIHTSNALLFEKRDVNPPQKNAEGMEYSEVIVKSFYDHDAFLLDEPGAATPSQGVGVGVNARVDGEEIESFTFIYNSTGLDMSGSPMQKIREAEQAAGLMKAKLKEAIKAYYEAKEEAEEEKEDSAEIQMNSDKWVWVQDWNQDTVIFECDAGLMSATYSTDGDTVTLTSEPEAIKVEPMYKKALNSARDAIKALFAAKDKTAYNTKDKVVNPISQNKEGTRMDKIIAALNAKGIQTNGLNDDQLLAEYDKMITANSGDAIAQAVKAAIEPLAQQVNTLQETIAANADKEKETMVNALVAADVGLDADDLKAMSVNSLQKLHAKHCQTTAGLNGAFNSASDAGGYKLEMPA
jgi:hypothetical protein